MKRKIVWLMVSCMMALSLVMTSCGEAEEEEEAGEVGGVEVEGGDVTVTTEEGDTTVIVVEEEEEEEEVVETGEPEYGGTITVVATSDWTAIDPTKAQAIRVRHMQYTSNELMQGDWTKGPQGSGQTDWMWGFLGDITLEAGELAESWETPDDTTIIYHLNPDAVFQDKPPANGRPVTAEDVVWNIDYQFNYPVCWQGIAYPPGCGLEPTSYTALDAHTVEVKVPAASQDIMLLEIGDNLYTNPPEVWTSGGDMTDWRDVVGSGPWILTDYVSGSGASFEKNPNYWEYDPNHPGNKVPYADYCEYLVITDLSTRLTALRTGAIDYLTGVLYDDAAQLKESYSDLLYTWRVTPPWVAAGRMDTPPFDDIRVRQAMNLAVNQQEILDDYFNGEAALVGYPYHPTKSHEKYYTPLEEMPADVQMLYTYDPDRAMELLDEAGLGTGFTTNIICQSVDADAVAIIAAYLDAVGITMNIQPVESGAYNSYYWGHTHEQMMYAQAKGCWAPYEMLMTKPGMGENFAIIDDPYFLDVQAVIGSSLVKDPDYYFETLKAAGVYELSLAWGIFTPAPYQYNFWWPWLKGYMGISSSGWANGGDNTKWFWVDQDLKKSMGY
ncbi:ABC transporter substrate-binding protein [Chloroflexota bacterium]